MYQTIEIQVEVDSSWRRNTEIQIFTDAGTGTVDTAAPLLSRRYNPYKANVDEGGYGLRRYGATAYGHLVAHLKGDGAGEYAYGEEPYSGAEKESFAVPVRVPDSYDVWKFAAQAVDAAGNAQSAALEEVSIALSGRSPKRVQDFAFTSYASRIATFSIGS